MQWPSIAHCIIAIFVHFNELLTAIPGGVVTINNKHEVSPHQLILNDSTQVISILIYWLHCALFTMQYRSELEEPGLH